MEFNSPNTVGDPSADLEFLRQALEQPEDNVVKELAKHIEKVWQQNQKDCKSFRQEMINTLRRVRGEYEPKKLADIRSFKGSETYLRTAENKARAAESWIKDIYRSDEELPAAIEPTIIPDLPDEQIAQIQVEVQQEAAMIQQQLMAGALIDPSTGMPLNPEKFGRLLNDYYQERLDAAKEDLVKEAKERCERAAKEIRDQNQEIGWDNVFNDFVYYFTRLKMGIIKGPILTKKKKQIWQPDETGAYSLQTIDTLVNDAYCVSPFNWFPSRGMKTPHDGDTIEIHELSKQALNDLIGVPGYDEAEIRAVLDKYAKGSMKAKWFTIEDETTVNQVTKEKNFTNATNPPTQNSPETNSDKIFAQEFYGSVSGRLLMEWGMKDQANPELPAALDPEMQYQANCWKIGDHVIKAVINPDSLGRKPYHVSSWAKNPEWIVGEGLIEFAAPIEDALNAITRALINNIAIASGPMAEIDKDRVDTKIPIYPWRQIESTSTQMKAEGPAVNYYQPNMHANELILAWQFFGKLLDEMTVPAYAQGASQSGVTAGTATVFTQLLAAASRSIKAVVANIDNDIISPYIQMCYDYNMRFGTDPTLKGDARVVAKGVSNLLAKEQAAQRKIEYLQLVMTPVLSQILGAKNLGAIAAQIAKANDISLPDMKRLEEDDSSEMIVQQMLMAQAGIDPMQMNGQVANGGGAIAQGQGMNPDGSKAGVNNG
jgi:hypothetical protein